MREKHPIDERFKALHDAEVSPPDDVRDALAQHLGWNPGTNGGTTWRGWLFIATGALLAITSATYLGSRESREPISVVQTRQDGPSEPGADTGRTMNLEGGAATTPRHGEHATSTGEAQSATKEDVVVPITPRSMRRAERSTRAESTPLIAGDHDGARFDHSQSDDPVLSTIGTKDPPVPVSTEQRLGARSDGGGSSWTSVNASSAPVTDPFSSTTTTMWSVAKDAVRMNGIPPEEREVSGGSPLIARSTPYVLPAGQWWVGCYAGVGRMQGTWRGEELEVLNEAERWRGSMQWGLLLGRRWRNGWSIFSGAGLGLMHSTLSYDERQMELFVDVDTSWSSVNYNDTEHVVYTWNIDSVSTMRPGTVRSTHSRNRYGALQIPLTVAWHGDLRRWHYGAFGGVVAWIPTQREGNTLHREAPDAASLIVDMQDARLNSRFGPRINAHTGISLGFALTEHLSVFAEPVLTLPISTFGKAESPWINGRYLQFRLQHEFGSSSR